MGLPQFKEYASQFISSIGSALCDRPSLSTEGFVLALHGFTLQKEPCRDFTAETVRPIKCQRTGTWYMVKRVRPSGKGEVDILRFLSSAACSDPRNHTAFPTAILWNDRIIVTPLYHSLGNVDLTPNMSLHLAKQYVEAIAFLHEHQIMHLDAEPRDTLLAIHPSLPHPRLLLTDFELSHRLRPGEDNYVDLWWLENARLQPPEGFRHVDGFAYDVWIVGRVLEYMGPKGMVINFLFKGVQWPTKLMEVAAAMQAEQPELRPTAAQALEMLSSIDEWAPMPYEGTMGFTTIQLGMSLYHYPMLAQDTSIPIPMSS